MTAQRVALITGSTSGIGFAIAERLAAEGFTIAFHSKSSADIGQQLASKYPQASYTQADLADEGETRNLIAQVLFQHQRLDVLVNNAGITATISHSDLQAATTEIWRSLYDVNVIAPWLLISEAETALTQAATPDCPSCIINITSHAGIRPKGASIPYAVTKAALNHMTKLLAVSLAPNIRVNAIAPGLVDTPMSKDWTAARQLWAERSPMRRGAQPAEIAQLAAMLVQNHYLTGETIIADGGLNLT
jgi:NAD(P)-dependent dehydrogenase (short-subunit alcohol dehydrogenase family)